MDVSSSSSFYSAKAEESPSTVVDIVPKLEALTMAGAEGTSASERSEYYSARCEEMMRSRDQFSDDVVLEMEFSKPHRSEVVRVEVGPQSAEEEKLNTENNEVLKQLRTGAGFLKLFQYPVRHYDLGRMIGKGGQAEIYEVVQRPNYLMKVFERGTSLRDLKRLWPIPVLNKVVRQCILYAGMLADGRFAFLMERCWGDLRKLIDQAKKEKNVNGIQGPPFPYNGWEVFNGKTFYSIDFMSRIATQMKDLHEVGVFHRDLKASNILLHQSKVGYGYVKTDHLVMVADFECSIGVMGTGFWRAPEILLAQQKRETIPNEQWEKADVYSFGMTCFEIVTGQIPFDGELGNTKVLRQLVIDGKRPELPSDLEEVVKDLITKCWAQEPTLRPKFSEIADVLQRVSHQQCQFRLFEIDDELPSEYCLATVQEVDAYPSAVATAMPSWEIANLANGSVDGYFYGMKTRLEKRSNVANKLARLHH